MLSCPSSAQYSTGGRQQVKTFFAGSYTSGRQINATGLSADRMLYPDTTMYARFFPNWRAAAVDSMKMSAWRFLRGAVRSWNT